jgi:energy-coupling factor transporter ATP-binding protein EcfA2
VGYYAQDQTEVLNVHRTVLEEAFSAAPAGWGESDVRTLLGRFCFSGDDVYKPIGVLSGGEKARLAIARLLLRPANLLLLDEPTNHLDLASREELERALKAFQGTVVMASHDRYFMDTVATKVGEVGDGRMRVYLGNYTSYRDRRVAAGGPSTSMRGMLNGAALRQAVTALENGVNGRTDGSGDSSAAGAPPGHETATEPARGANGSVQRHDERGSDAHDAPAGRERGAGRRAPAARARPPRSASWRRSRPSWSG